MRKPSAVVRSLLSLFAGIMLLIGLSAPASAGHFILEPNVYCLANGHCYQHGLYREDFFQETLTHDAIIAFAETQTYADLAGHLITIETQGEYTLLADFVPHKVYSPLAARLDAGGAYRWIAGPEAGNPVLFFGGAGNGHPACAPFPGICFSYVDYTFSQAHYVRGWACGCGVSDGVSFTIEYEPGPTGVARSSWGAIKLIYR